MDLRLRPRQGGRCWHGPLKYEMLGSVPTEIDFCRERT
jgi:hypothetical protein